VAVNEKAVAVAKDVLAHLDTIRARRGIYMNGYIPRVDRSEDLQKHADTVTTNCKMCALGALMLSKARLYNDVPMRSIADNSAMFDDQSSVYASRSDVERAISEIFSLKQMAMIETAFEGGTCSAQDCDTDTLSRAAAYTRGVDDSSERIRMVMQNIIDNGGEFIPPEVDTVTSDDDQET